METAEPPYWDPTHAPAKLCGIHLSIMMFLSWTLLGIYASLKPHPGLASPAHTFLLIFQSAIDSFSHQFSIHTQSLTQFDCQLISVQPGHCHTPVACLLIYLSVLSPVCLPLLFVRSQLVFLPALYPPWPFAWLSWFFVLTTTTVPTFLCQFSPYSCFCLVILHFGPLWSVTASPIIFKSNKCLIKTKLTHCSA